MADKSRSKLPLQFQIYVWIYLLIIALLPLLIIFRKAEKYPWLLSYLWPAAVWPAIAAIIFWYTSRRCSSRNLRFFDGLVFITIAMNIGWTAMSFFFGFFGVLASLLLSPLAALYGDIRRNRNIASDTFYRRVLKFYRGGLYTGERMERQEASQSKKDRVLSVTESSDGKERVVIVQRPDRSYSYRRQWLSVTKTTDPDSPIVTEEKEGEWGPLGPYCGIYDSAETAESEACVRVPWLKAQTLH